MATEKTTSINKSYIIVVTALTLAFPLISYFIEELAFRGFTGFSLTAIGKWFIFYAVGFRLFMAGIRQTAKPAFTAVEIFHLKGTESYPVIRELGFANLCFGLIGLISLFVPGWRIVSAFGSGLYYGLAGVQHWLRKDAEINEKFALYSDVFIFICLAALVILTIVQ